MQICNQPAAGRPQPKTGRCLHLRAVTCAAALLLVAISLPAATAAQSGFDLRAAITSAQPGATIHVPAGTYAVPIVIDKPLTLSGVETLGFLEATALFAQSVAEIHGIPVENPDRARALVLTLMLGKEGIELVSQLAGQAAGKGVTRDKYWGELVTKTIPRAAVGPLVDRLKTVFMRHFAVRGGD